MPRGIINKSESLAGEDVPQIQASGEQYGLPGKKPKDPAPKKRQRGQKKPKNAKVKVQVEADPVTAPEGTPSSIHEEVSGAEVQVGYVEPAATDVSLPPKKAKKARKRKDGYDPASLGAEVTVPSQSRLAAITRNRVVDPQNVVSRPVGNSAGSPVNVRDREISQLKRRYGDSLKVDTESINYALPFTPSDPDFPYELPALLINLHVPLDYPKEAVTLTVKSGLEVGFSRNIEREFVAERIGYGFAGRGLLGMLTWLDRNLERILGMKKTDTMKIVRPPRSDAPPPVVPVPHGVLTMANMHTVSSEPIAAERTQQQLEEAKTQRNTELSKLRMIHPSQLHKDSFDLDISTSLKIRLQIPSAFPLDPAWLIVLMGDESIEVAANQELRQSQRGLARTLNWIAANVKKLKNSEVEPSKTSEPETSAQTADVSKTGDTKGGLLTESAGFQPVVGQIYSVPTDIEEDANFTDDSGDSYSSGDDHHFEIEEEDEDEDIEDAMDNLGLNTKSVNQQKSDTLEKTQEKGTAINASVNMTNIALLEPLSISLTLKCLRCKSTGNHIETVLSGKSAEVQCATCSSLLSVGFRGQAIHQASSRIGYLDLTGASVLDLGPGTFKPTCEKCDEVATALKGLIAGQPQTRPCRACHIKQTVSITSTSFLIVSSATKNAQIGHRDAQNLNLQRGKPLPNNGVCKHFRKSNRWFRYSCCSRVYACLICHDELTDHPMELARFQICGWCSKESAIRGLKPCVHCGRDLTRRSRGGFWEGGQGVRDQARMNRNDPRKHRKKIGSSKKKST